LLFSVEGEQQHRLWVFQTGPEADIST